MPIAQAVYKPITVDLADPLGARISIFRDDPIEGPLQEASMGVWTKILQEES